MQYNMFRHGERHGRSHQQRDRSFQEVRIVGQHITGFLHRYVFDQLPHILLNPLAAKFVNLNFNPLEVVSR